MKKLTSQIDGDRQASRDMGAPQIIQSALFIILFTATSFLTVLGALYSLSDIQGRAAQAYPILLFTLGLIAVLGFYMVYRVWVTLFTKNVRRAAPLLHRRFVLFFSLAALLPAVLVGAFSTSLITKNINDLFGEDVSQTLDGAYSFLNKYVADELRDLRFDMLSAERFLQVNQPIFDNRISYTAYLQRFARTQNVDAVYVLNREGVVFARALGPNSPELRLPTPSAFDFIDDRGITGVQTQDDIDYLVGFTKLRGYDETFLLVGKYLKSNVGVLSSLTGIQDAKGSLVKYQDDQGYFQKVFFVTLLNTALLILLTAIWLGIAFANRVIEPIGRLVEAAEQVRDGDLEARVNVRRDWGEMSDLGSAFNRMTRQLGTQREDLVQAHNLSEQRRQFSEAVLSGVTAGVMGLSQDGRITLMNRSAERLTGKLASNVLGHPIELTFPEFGHAFNQARENISETTEHQINLETEQGTRNVDLRVSAYQGDSQETGWVMTFDDMTRLVAAQRHSAWRDVARRIAHEIKNPLTPIQLSAERLRRKYSKKLGKDAEVFENCTNTIIRQVGSLEQMVNEFSTFARTPAPVFEITDTRLLLEAAIFEQGVAYPDIKFVISGVDEGEAWTSCDSRLMAQALANIYKNAAISVSSRIDETGLELRDGLIETRLFNEGENLVVAISDNGKGWPYPDRDRLLEPYMTTRESGTGLGLAIVKRIIEDHQGSIHLDDRSDNKSGAEVRLIIPRISAANPQENILKTTVGVS